MKTLKEIINSIECPRLRKTCHEIPLSPHSPFGMWPASLSYHHAYPGGLVVHTLEVCRIADDIINGGSVGPINRDHVIAACLWHDFAKTSEYVLVRPFDADKVKRKLDAISGTVWIKNPLTPDKGHPHIQDSADAFGRAALECAVDIFETQHIKDCILSHHGRLEWGAVHEPKTLEAELVHYADMLSARMGAAK